MRIGFIGAGKVATPFGRHLASNGLTVSGYHDRHDDKMTHAARHTGSQSFKDIAHVAELSDVIFITTRDDQIAGVCHQLCQQGCVTSGHLLGHMSGAHSSRILSEARQMGATVFSLHPLQAFAHEEKALADLPNTYFSLEAENGGPGPILDILAQMGNPYFTLAPEHKSLYHLSACMLSNYLVTLMASGLSALENSGIDPQEGFQAMRPLIDGTLANIAHLGPAQALTGPIARGDSGTIENHMDTLKTLELDHIRSVYTTMGIKTLELATEKHLKATDKVATIRQILKEK